MPIDIASGAVFSLWQDFSLSGTHAFTWDRFYSTKNTTLTPLGIGWRSNVFSFLKISQKMIIYFHDDGEIAFPSNIEKRFTSNSIHQQILFTLDDGYKLYNWEKKTNLVFKHSKINPETFILHSIEPNTWQKWSLLYDEKERLTSIVKFPSHRIRVRYNDDDFVEVVELLYSNKTIIQLVMYEYDDNKRLTAAYNSYAVPIIYNYDKQNNLISETNRLGFTFFFEYDDHGRCIHTFGQNKFGERWFSYDTLRNQTKEISTQGGTWTYFWNTAGQITKKIDPLGAATESFYDSQGRHVLTKIASDIYFQLQYDIDGNLIRIADAKGYKVQYLYNTIHLPIKRINADGTERRWIYDDTGNLVEKIDESGAIWRYIRDNEGRLTVYETPNGHRTTFIYNDLNSTIELKDSEGFILLEYDILGNFLRISDSLGLIESREYDKCNNLIAIISSKGFKYLFSYDNDSNIILEEDELGRKTQYSYTPFGQVSEIINSDSSRIRRIYDSEGRIVKVVNENDDINIFEYNQVGDVVFQQFFDGRIERYRYDLIGNLIEITKPDGNRIEQKFDVNGNIIEKVYNGKLLARFLRDKHDRITIAESSYGLVELSFDSMGRIIKEKQGDYTVNKKYDPEGNIISRSIISENYVSEISFEYDLRRRLRKILFDDGSFQEFFYNSGNLLITRSIGPDVKEILSYDTCRRLINQEVKKTNSLLIKRNYEYNKAGDVIEINNVHKGITQYKYNSRDWVIKEKKPFSVATDFHYDRCGNIGLKGNTSYSSRSNRLLTRNSAQFDYSDNGELILISEPLSSMRFEYDGEENIVKVNRSNRDSISYGYDAFRRRIYKVTGREKEQFIWANHQLAAEELANGNLIEYLILSYHPYAQRVDNEWYGIITNHISFPQEIISPLGQLSWKADFDAFGKLLRESGPGPRCSIRLPGQYSDSETGLFYNRYRYYDPDTARYISSDPIGIFGGLNEYRYDRNPINWEDPLGLKCKLIHFRIKRNPKIGTLANWKAKRNAFNAAREDPNARIPSKQDYDQRIRPAADGEAAAARRSGGFSSTQDADHPGDVRATGLLGQTLEPLDSGVNRSFGSRVGRQARQRTPGDRTPMVDLIDDQGNIIS